MIPAENRNSTKVENSFKKSVVEITPARRRKIKNQDTIPTRKVRKTYEKVDFDDFGNLCLVAFGV